MARVLRNMAVVAVAMLSLTGCFKEVTTDTTLRIKTLIEEKSGGERVAAKGCFAYIYYTDNTDWTVASYEDAYNKTITNLEKDEKMSEPNGESKNVSEEWESKDENSNKDSKITIDFLSLEQQGNKPALLVVVYPEAQMYAYLYRKAEAENLPYTYLTLIFHKWKEEVYTEGSKEGYKWTVVPPEAKQEPEEPTEPTEPSEPSVPTEPTEPTEPETPPTNEEENE